ncbi:MAG: Na+/H+ antiporter NhaC family protein [Bacteroidota bacterium]
MQAFIFCTRWIEPASKWLLMPLFMFIFAHGQNFALCQPQPFEWADHTVSAGRSCALPFTLINVSVGSVDVAVDGQKTKPPLHPAWSLLPPLLAILFALWFREVYSSLLAGILAGSYLLAYSSRGAIEAIGVAMGDFPTQHLIPALSDADHQSIIVFSMLIGGMVALVSRNGGMQGVVEALARRAKTPQSAQFMTWLLGVLIFFDDYANTLLVGNTMRPVTDRLRVSREKLSYLVDATAAPVAAIAFISTWIGAEISYIEGGLEKLPGVGLGAYQVFLYSLSYAFYPIFTLIFMLLIIGMKRDFGPMFAAEWRARSGASQRSTPPASRLEHSVSGDAHGVGGETHLGDAGAGDAGAGDADFSMAPGLTPSPWRAIIPFLVVVLLVLLGLAATGYEPKTWADSSISRSQKLSITIGEANAYTALLWGSFGGLLTAVALSLLTRRLSVHDAVESVLKGFKTMLGAVIILILAWVLAGITEKLETANFLTQQLLSVNLGPGWLPTLTFILAALVAFSTGTSWGTMAILFPLVIPASWQLTEQAGIPHAEAVAILCNVVSTVLAGSVLGDHCSPISDTTIMSSLASGCSHIEHVRTQLPYALVVGGVSLVAGSLPTGFGLPPWISFMAGTIIMAWIILRWGKKVVDEH